MNWLRLAVLSLSVACLSSSSTNADTLYVTVVGSGAQNCSSWKDACDLPSALDVARNDTRIDEVWVAAGVYHGSITLVDGVKIIGGFDGTETLPSQSDPVANQTTLDGDGIGPIVMSLGDSTSTMLRGFRITNGYNNAGILELTNGGGGMNLVDSDAMFVECVVDLTSGDWWGGAMVIKGGSPEFINCRFHNNGEVEFESGVALVLAGGVVFLSSGTPQFTNCLFANNTAMEGGVVAIDYGTPTFINCTFADNHAVIGQAGGLFDAFGDATVKNSIFWGNTAIRGFPDLVNFRGRFSELSNTDIPGGYVGEGNIDADPLFDRNYRLDRMSPCRNTGEMDSLPLDIADLDWDGDVVEYVPFDLNGTPRKVGLNVDMGAYEAKFALKTRFQK